MGIGGSIRARWIFSAKPTTEVKLGTSSHLGRDPDRRWCRRHTNVKLSWSHPMEPCAKQQHTRMLPPMSMKPWDVIKKLYHTRRVAVTPSPVRIPTQRPIVPSFTSVVGLVEKSSTCLRSRYLLSCFCLFILYIRSLAYTVYHIAVKIPYAYKYFYGFKKANINLFNFVIELVISVILLLRRVFTHVILTRHEDSNPKDIQSRLFKTASILELTVFTKPGEKTAKRTGEWRVGLRKQLLMNLTQLRSSADMSYCIAASSWILQLT